MLAGLPRSMVVDFARFGAGLSRYSSAGVTPQICGLRPQILTILRRCSTIVRRKRFPARRDGRNIGAKRDIVMDRTKNSAFPWRDFLKRLAVIAIPVALQNLLTTTASMVDTMMVAPLGETTVGALGLCAQFSSLMFSCYWGFVGGGSLFFSQYWGSKEDDGIERSYGMTWRV